MDYKEDYNKLYCDAFDKLKNLLKRHSAVIDIIVKGSLNIKEQKLPYWSDLDISVIIKDVSLDLFKHISSCYSSFKNMYPQIKLSLTLINEEDNLNSNYLHHHGIKPLAFNYELQSQTTNSKFNQFSAKPSKNTIIISSVYRYYEILYDFRKNVISNNMSNIEFVSRYFHRASRFIRTQFEIINPQLLDERNIIDEEKYIHKFGYELIIGDFFEVKQEVEENWLTIIEDSKQLEYYKEYLIKKIEEFNKHFLPNLIKISERYKSC